MKKVNLLIISLAGALSLCACGNNEKSKSSEFKPAPEKNETFKFNEIESTCLVNPKIKAYVDAMKEQEKTLPYPYRISSLYGPEDFGWQKADTKDGATYAPEETGGVDVCTMLNRKDYNDKNIPEDIVISWDKGKSNYDTSGINFLFSLDTRKFYKNTSGSNHTYHNESYGPTFGGGHDFYISDGCMSNQNSYTSKSSYEMTSTYELNGGTQKFKVLDYEVYKV